MSWAQQCKFTSQSTQVLQNDKCLSSYYPSIKDLQFSQNTLYRHTSGCHDDFDHSARMEYSQPFGDSSLATDQLLNTHTHKNLSPLCRNRKNKNDQKAHRCANFKGVFFPLSKETACDCPILDGTSNANGAWSVGRS